jgi:hypothetical protein
MIVLKYTKKLIKALGKNADKIFSSASDKKDASVLGEWSANLVKYAGIRFILFVNDKTLLTIFLVFKPKENILERFQQALLKELLRLDIPSDRATEETLKFSGFSLEKNTDKSMTSYMNQLSFDYQVMLDMQLQRKEFLDIEKA